MFRRVGEPLSNSSRGSSFRASPPLRIGANPVRTPLIVGNWKMFTTPTEAAELATDISRRLDGFLGIEIALAVPYTSLAVVGPILGGTGIELGAQDLHWEDRGPYTGAVSHGMLEALGCRYVLVGHSERREHFGETDRLVDKKILAALRGGLRPILCVGEEGGDREAGRVRNVLRRQVGQEPSRLGRVLYGGSVTGENAAGFAGRPDVDGVLLGGASLRPADFTAVVRAGWERRPPVG